MDKDEQSKRWGYEAAVSVGVIMGGIAGIFGGLIYYSLGGTLGGMDHYAFIGAFGGLPVALFFNHTIRNA